MKIETEIKTRQRDDQSGGFTLVEMLIVLAIVGLLAALCLSAFGAVRERGRQTVCAEQLHQIGLAFTMYSHDFDRRPPQLETLQTSYLKSPALFLCPSDPWLSLAGDAGTNARQNFVARVDACPPLLFPISYYYSGADCDALSPEDAAGRWSSLTASMGSATGIAACRVHGTRANGWDKDDVHSSAYEGRVLRLQLDGAVVTRNYLLVKFGSDRLLDSWSLFSDKPHKFHASDGSQF